MPRLPDLVLVIGMHSRPPASSFSLFLSHRQIVDQALIVIGDIPIGSGDPDPMGECINQGMDFRFSSLARGDVSVDIDEGADEVILVSITSLFLLTTAFLLVWLWKLAGCAIR